MSKRGIKLSSALFIETTYANSCPRKIKTHNLSSLMSSSLVFFAAHISWHFQNVNKSFNIGSCAAVFKGNALKIKPQFCPSIYDDKIKWILVSVIFSLLEN